MRKIDAENFCSVIRDSFEHPPQELRTTTVLRELDGWDSLTSVMLVAQIYADFRVQISGDEMSACRTVGDLMTAIETKLAALA